MFKRKKQTKEYDRENYKPVILTSICTGEQTAGFKNVNTGEFHDECLIRNEKDLYDFKEKYGITEELEKIC